MADPAPELYAVAGSAILLLVLLLAHQLYNDKHKGTAWALGNREDQEVDATSARLARMVANHRENMLIFVPLALALVVADLSTPVTAVAAFVFLAARIGHAISYGLGVIYVRSAFWVAGIGASLVTGWPVLTGWL